ncbi:MAG TPA: HD domain-containing protein [Bacillota bacterium]|jgi:metal-dependent HD superfamily phosphatase/phosphodiesterase|nr:HD domain-containing protein [Bacillota bacterium]HOP69829.1 HD domain-containing protein [Bacillota bacterium]HPZ64181.1 HD domain-containing protein [Bacillota bacterium]HQD05511.1 HD domain-containing protein [Bacillota bacterium]
MAGPRLVTLEQVEKHPMVRVFIEKANEHLAVLGFTEHEFRHCRLVANRARKVLQELDGASREAELAAIAGYLHDIGNVMGRREHDVAGAMIAMQILRELGMPLEEVAEIIAAIGNHDEDEGQVVNRVSAALILADKSDVHRGRVRNPDFATFDIHDRVNYAVESSMLEVDPARRVITLSLQIDTAISQVMEYFEIFLTRMVMCRRAATFLRARFALIINDAELL